LEYTVLDGSVRSAHLTPGEVWTFGRDHRCSESLVLPALSRVALAVRCLEEGLCRVTSRQSGMGRTLIDADDDREHHVVALGAGPVHLRGGNYTIKVELPPIVLRLQLAVPLSDRAPAVPARTVSPQAASDRTVFSWTLKHGTAEAEHWISVVALAVALSRYPELAVDPASESGHHVRTSEALRRLAGVWCGHTSLYWVNERLKEAVDAADLVVPDGGERLAVAVAHYGMLFPPVTIRKLRDELLALQAGGGAT
jgi:hypothetical protein